MQTAFHLKSTPAARVLMGRDRARLVQEIVSDAEKLGVQEDEHAIFHVHGLELTAVVQLQARIIHVMTVAEAKKAGLGCRCPPGTDKRGGGAG